jgi:hypothetical protein
VDDLWRPPASEREPWRWPLGLGARVYDWAAFSMVSFLAAWIS